MAGRFQQVLPGQWPVVAGAGAAITVITSRYRLETAESLAPVILVTVTILSSQTWAVRSSGPAAA